MLKYREKENLEYNQRTDFESELFIKDRTHTRKKCILIPQKKCYYI